MSIAVVNTAFSFSNLSFPSEGNLLYVDDSVSISTEDIEANSQSDFTEAVFFSFTNLHQILGQARIDLQDHQLKSDHVLNSRIVSASIGRAGRHVELKNPATITFRHLDTNMTEPVCVFWDFEDHSWSDAGCGVKDSNDTVTVCQCDHLTNFAVLMRPKSMSGAEMFFSGFVRKLDIVGSIAAAVVVFVLIIVVLKVSLVLLY